MKKAVTGQYYVRIVREGGHFIKAWRKHKKLSVHDLSARVSEQNEGQKNMKVSASMISQLEQGKAGYTQKTLELLAKALDLQPWQLLAGEPGKTKDFWRSMIFDKERNEIWDTISENDKPALEEMISNNCEAAVGAALKSAGVVFKKKNDRLSLMGM